MVLETPEFYLSLIEEYSLQSFQAADAEALPSLARQPDAIFRGWVKVFIELSRGSAPGAKDDGSFGQGNLGSNGESKGTIISHLQHISLFAWSENQRNAYYTNWKNIALIAIAILKNLNRV